MPAFCEQTDVFISGTRGYHTYRIPSIVSTPHGTIMMFCEGRKYARSDTGRIDMLCKRSTDGGITWSDTQVIWNDGENTCGNPCPVVDEVTGTIWLLMTHNLGEDKESEIIDRKSKGTRTIWVTSSMDDGLTWEDPVEITESVKDKNWTWYATGPGAGIQLTGGRLLIPCDHIEALSKRYFSHVIYSDNHGESWKLGGATPEDDVNECEAVELENGVVVLNMRNYDRKQKTRAIAVTYDGGDTWSHLMRDPTLIEPTCQASIRRYPSEGDYILFSNPANETERENMTIRLSTDGCRSWGYSQCLHPGPAAYSCLTVFPDGTIGCLYERGEAHSYQRLTLARFNLAWIMETRLKAETPGYIY